MIKVATPPRVYPPVGWCIYCASDDRDLRREHIIPYGIGGNLILPKASCRVCEAITGRVEQITLRGLLHPTRVRLDLQSRTKKHWPGTLPVHIVDSKGEVEIQPVSIAEYPLALLTFVLEPPGILCGRPPSKVDTCKPQMIWRNEDADKITNGWASPHAVQPSAFFRMLAKVGHAALAANMGWKNLNEFRLLLPNLILGRSETASHFVGTIEGAEDGNEILHSVRTHNLAHEGRTYAVADICLFAMMGAPRYRVVVGEWPKDP